MVESKKVCYENCKIYNTKRFKLFETQPCAKPICKKARYLCLLARREKLSLKELYLLEKIGFCLEFKYEDRSASQK